ncbi:MAG: type II secretion system GspH family protein [Lentisphaeraceae bacterium]|nr:type II secretion system GspH family protein [Lentisphaeraceae bacterium]
MNHRLSILKQSFTLIELLVVIAILSILIPSLQGAREAAKFGVCRSNLSQHHNLIMEGVKDNNGRIPRINNFVNSQNPSKDLDLINHDWYGAQKSSFTMRNPAMGLYTDSFEILRCPALSVSDKGSGVDSNGSYDYSITAAFSIAFVAGIESNSRWGTTWASGKEVPTPLILDEEAASINGTSGEGGFCQTDKFDSRHITDSPKGAWGSIDGSVYTYTDPKVSEFRSFSKFFSGLPDGRYDLLKSQTPPHISTGNSRVWQRRDGIGNQ